MFEARYLTPEEGSDDYKSIVGQLATTHLLRSSLENAFRQLETYTEFGIGSFSQKQKTQLQKEFLKHSSDLSEEQVETVEALSYLGLPTFDPPIVVSSLRDLDGEDGSELNFKTELTIISGSKPIPCSVTFSTRNGNVVIKKIKIDGMDGIDVLKDSTCEIDPDIEIPFVDPLSREIQMAELTSLSDLLSLMHEQAHLENESPEIFKKRGKTMLRINFFSRSVSKKMTKLDFHSALTNIQQQFNISRADILQPVTQAEVDDLLKYRKKCKCKCIEINCTSDS